MSLLEDIYLEEDDGGNDLERIIEGDDLDTNEARSDESDDGGNKSDEAEEEKRRVDPKEPKQKRVSKNPRFLLNPARLTGPRGIQTIQEHFKDFKFKGKGHEQEDLDVVLKKLEHWAHRLYPKFQFDDCLEKIEALGRKRQVATHIKKIRQDLLDLDIPIAQQDSSEDEAAAPVDPPPLDEFDQLLEQQIAIARSTPASVTPGSKAEQTPYYVDPVNGTPRRGTDDTFARFTPTNSTPVSKINTSIYKPNSTSGLTEEQKERILRNRQLAEQKRLERLKTQQQGNNTSPLPQNVGGISQEKSKENNGKEISIDVELNCLQTDQSDIVKYTDENSDGKVSELIPDDIEKVKNRDLEGDAETSVIDVDAIEFEKNTYRKVAEKNNLNGIEIELTSDDEGNIEKEPAKHVDSNVMVIGEDIEDDSNEKYIENTKSNTSELERQKNATVDESGDEEVSMSLEYNDENSMDP